MKYFEILTHHYAWSNKEFEEFQTSFASSKTTYFIRLFGILTSEAGIFRQEILCCLLKVSCSILTLIVLRPSDFALKRLIYDILHCIFVRVTLEYIRNYKTVQKIIENGKTEINFDQNRKPQAKGGANTPK